MTGSEQAAFYTLRQADETFLPSWQLAKRAGLTCRQTVAAVRGLRHAGLVVKRPCADGLSAFEISLTRGGVR